MHNLAQHNRVVALPRILSLSLITEQVRTRLNETGLIWKPDHNKLYHLGKTYELEVKDGAINATDVGKIKSPAGAVTRVYDPAYMNTVNCISKISFINGEKGILEYRGYPIEQLAEKSSFLETCFLLVNGELPTEAQLQRFTKKVMKNSAYHHGLE